MTHTVTITPQAIKEGTELGDKIVELIRQSGVKPAVGTIALGSACATIAMVTENASFREGGSFTADDMLSALEGISRMSLQGHRAIDAATADA